MLKKEVFSPAILQNLTPTSMKLIPHLARYTDHDGVVHMEMFKRQFSLKYSKFSEAIGNLIENKILHSEENTVTFLYAYSYKNDLSYRYINSYEFMSFASIFDMSKRPLMLLFHLLQLKKPGTYHLTAFENLYQTSFNQAKDVLFENHNEAYKALAVLLKNRLITIRIARGKNALSGESATDLTTLKEYLGYSLHSKKKARTSFGKRHVLSIAVNPKLIGKSSILKNVSSYVELEHLCEEYNLDFSQFKGSNNDQENMQVRYLIGLKNELFQEFGVPGVTLYREALTNYFRDHHHSIEWYMKKDNVVDFFKNIYVLPKLQKHILAAIEGCLNGTRQNEYLTKATKLLLKHGNDSTLIETDIKIQESVQAHGLDDGKSYDVLGSIHTEWLHIQRRVGEAYRHIINRAFTDDNMLFNNDLIRSVRKLVLAERYIDDSTIKKWGQHLRLSIKPLERKHKVADQKLAYTPAVDSMFKIGR
ncbi:hypothetical protein AB3N04_01055 (plasmid) [Alkalihalophilus sp. As8PL]|uniref:Uncharacterized protein n=1 Tax=Alkalihalophilus sp. As8PL TaxID=3237103 RepID=A0AB39BN32_9BACI